VTNKLETMDIPVQLCHETVDKIGAEPLKPDYVESRDEADVQSGVGMSVDPFRLLVALSLCSWRVAKKVLLLSLTTVIFYSGSKKIRGSWGNSVQGPNC